MRRLVAVLAAAGVAACSGSLRQTGVQKVRLAIHQDPIASLPMRVAQTLGYYQDSGIVVEASEVPGGTKALQALVGGSVDVAAASMSDAAQLAVEGREVRGILVLYTRPTAALAVAPSLKSTIRTIHDLKGRTVGVSAPGSGSHQILNFLLVANGLSPDAVSTVSVGMAGSSVAALEHGTVDAAVLIASAISVFEKRQPGQPFLVDLRTPDGAREIFGSEVFPSLGLLAEDRWLRANPDAARRLVRAVTRGMQWIRDRPAEQVRDLLAGAVRTTPEADLQAIRQMQQVLSSDGLMPAGSAELIARFVAVSNPAFRASSSDLARIYTNEFARAK